MAAHPGAPPELPLAGQSQKDSWMDERGEGGVEVLLQGLLQQALVRKVFLKPKQGQEPRDTSAGFTCERNRPSDQFVISMLSVSIQP